MIGENADALCAALAADQTNQDAESAKRAEVAPALAVLRAAIDNVGLWMRPESDRGLLARLGGGGDYVEYLPVGVMGISVPASRSRRRTANFLASARAPGNRVRRQFDAASPNLQNGGAAVRD